MSKKDSTALWREQMMSRSRPSFGAEMAALWRAGREDLHNNLISPFPGQQQTTREMGAPGTPTPSGVDRQLNKDQSREM